MEMDLLEQKIKVCEEHYRKFMGLDPFPVYKLQRKEVRLDTALQKGFDSIAAASYDVQAGEHRFLVSTNLSVPEYVMFHEFTHILDSERYVKNDKVRYAGLSGFSEYHASQVELIQLLGAASVHEIESFSMDNIINTISGTKSVNQYVEQKRQHAIELFSRRDFPADLDTLKGAFGVLFNYFGLRSICELYSIDFTEKIENESFLKIIPTQQFVPLNNLMHGWLNESMIDVSIKIYLGTIFPLIQEFHLA